MRVRLGGGIGGRRALGRCRRGLGRWIARTAFRGRLCRAQRQARQRQQGDDYQLAQSGEDVRGTRTSVVLPPVPLRYVHTCYPQRPFPVSVYRVLTIRFPSPQNQRSRVARAFSPRIAQAEKATTRRSATRAPGTPWPAPGAVARAASSATGGWFS